MDAAMQYSTAQFLVEGAGVNALLSTSLQAIWNLIISPSGDSMGDRLRLVCARGVFVTLP